MRKRNLLFNATLAASLAGGAIVTVQPVQANEGGKKFSDIKPGSAYEEALESLIQQQIIFGYPDGTYRPSEMLNRGQTALILARALQLDLKNVENPGFNDITEKSDIYQYVAALANAGIMEGYSDGTFKAEKFLTRAEIAKILITAFQLPKEELVDNPFVDVSKTEWYAPYLTALINEEITVGITPTRYEPDQQVNRGQMALFVYRCLQLEQQPSKIEIESEVITITSDSIQLGKDLFKLSDEQRKWITPTNLPALKNAVIKANVQEGKLLNIESVDLRANGKVSEDTTNPYKNHIELNGNGAVIDTTFIINGDNLSLTNVTINENLQIGNSVKNNFYLEDVTVKGLTSLNESKIITATLPKYLVGTPESFNPKIHLHNSNMQAIEVVAKGGAIQLTGQSSVKEIQLLADCLVDASESISIPIIKIGSSTKHVALNVSVESLILINNEIRLTLEENAKIEDLVMPSEFDVKSILLNYEEEKYKIIRINGSLLSYDQPPSEENAGGSDGENDLPPTDTGSATKLQEAKDAVAALFSDSAKTDLKADIDQEAIDAAQAKVKLVVDGTEKANLITDIQKAQKLLNTQLEATKKLQEATLAVAGLFADYPTNDLLAVDVDQEVINSAKGKVEALDTVVPERVNLLADIQKAQGLLNPQLEAAIKLQQATDAVAVAEISKEQSDIDNAQSLVTDLADSAGKTALQVRLVAVKEAIKLAQVNTVVAQIAALDKNSATFADYVMAARTAFDSLTEEQQQLVENVDTLLAAEVQVIVNGEADNISNTLIAYGDVGVVVHPPVSDGYSVIVKTTSDSSKYDEEGKILAFGEVSVVYTIIHTASGLQADTGNIVVSVKPKINLDEVSINVESNQLMDTAIGMQYSITSTDGMDGIWVDATDLTTDVPFTTGNVYVREEANHSNSRLIATIAVPIESPTITFSFDEVSGGRLMGSTEEMEYSLNGGESWSAVSESDLKFTSAELTTITSQNDIKVRFVATKTMLASEITVLDITSSDSPTSVAVTAVDNIITGVTEGVTYEIDLNGDDVYEISATADSNHEIKPTAMGNHIWGAGDTFSIRVKASGNKMASNELHVVVTPIVITTSVTTRPTPPSGYRYESANVFGFIIGDYTYWTYDDTSNGMQFLIVAYDSSGTEVKRWSKPGYRYTNNISIDNNGQTIKISVQQNSLTIPWEDLYIK